MDMESVKKIYTVDDVLEMEGHVELIDGQLVIRDYTTPRHNKIVSDIAVALNLFIKKNNGDCEVFQENVALWVGEILGDESKNNFFLPDVMVVCGGEKIDEKGVHATPDFIVEVISDSSRTYDTIDKLFYYKKIGVREYWTVDEKRKTVRKYLLEKKYNDDTTINPTEIPVSIYGDLLKIDFRELFR